MPHFRFSPCSKLFVLALLAFATSGLLAPAPARAICDPEVYETCWSQNLSVNPSTCQCGGPMCFGIVESDCTEIGKRLDYGTCTCVSGPGYQGNCDVDPYACGCPGSFEPNPYNC